MSVSVIGGPSFVLVATLLVVASEVKPLMSFSGYGCNSEEVSELKYVINCDPHLDGQCSTSSLEWIASDVAQNSQCNINVNININTSQLLLKGNATFSGIQILTINGKNDLNTTITCQEGDDYPGLIFRSINGLEIRDLSLVNCGALYSKRFSYSSAITIIDCKDVLVENVNIMKSVGLGLCIFEQQGGFVQVRSSTFTDNILPEHYHDLRINGGGGVYVGNFKRNALEYEPITFRFERCSFERNVAHSRYYNFLYTNDLGEPVSGHGLGGGAAILFDKGLKDVHVIFSQCIFLKNEAFKGAGICVDIEGHRTEETRNVSFRLENSIFEGNGCSSSNPAASGGGASFNFASHNRTNFDSNRFVLFNVTFKNNCAHFGGGLYFYSEHLANAALSNTFNVEKCNFIGNSAHAGSAVDITPNVFERLSNGILTIPVFKDCTFSNNTVIINFQPNRTQTTYGIATVYISLYSVKLEGYNNFENNLGTAIHIVNGNINMSESSVHFYNNTGIQGGAVALIGESSIILGPNRNYSFENNKAFDTGGGLYVKVVDNHDITASKTCFIQYYEDGKYYTPAQKWKATVTFTGNRADTMKGHSIFATSLYPCQIINVSKKRKKVEFMPVEATEVFNVRRITIEEDPTLEGQQVATEGAILQYSKGYPLKVIPGEQFSHGVTIIDDLKNQTKVVLTASIPNDPNVRLDTAFSSCVGEKMVLKGKPGERANLYLHTTTSRLSYIRLPIKLVECPPGFAYSEILSKCVCISQEYVGVLTCNTTVFYSHITPGFWIGLVSDLNNESRKELVTSYCPQTFCNYNSSHTSEAAIKLPRKLSRLNEAQCDKTRTGIACGSCVSDHTTYYHSPNYKCKPTHQTLCKLGWLFYILSELVPVTVVFIAVVTLNISFTSGSVNGFILFSQLLSSLHIDASGIISLPKGIADLSKGYKLIYGFFNLEFFQIDSLSFCLWSQASALDMLAFKYVTIVYALLLVVLVIWFMNKCGGKCLGRWFRITTVKSSVIQGISAFLILCYSQCVRVSLNLLNPCPLFVRENSNLTVAKRVWLDANIQHFSKSHLPYALPALFCLLIVGVVPPLLLLAYPLSNQIMTFIGIGKFAEALCQKLRISRLKPLLDAFQGTFKDNMRFFAGLYFLYRWIALILTITLSDFYKVYTALEVLLVVILALHSLCQPYALKAHNMIDTLLIGNLALINAITFVHYYIFRTRTDFQAATGDITVSAAIQLVLVYVPLVVMGVYILVLVCRRGYKQADKRNAEWTKSITLQKLTSSFSKEDSHEDDLPYRLIADADDNDRNTYAHTEIHSSTKPDGTY